jgi:hypothetical protein
MRGFQTTVLVGWPDERGLRSSAEIFSLHVETDARTIHPWRHTRNTADGRSSISYHHNKTWMKGQAPDRREGNANSST